MSKRFISNEEVMVAARRLRDRLLEEGYKWPNIYGVPRGGIPAAYALVQTFGRVVSTVEEADFIVDDIWDSGRTAKKFEHYNKPFFVLFDKRRAEWAGKWLVMPWEVGLRVDDTSDHDIVTRLLERIGEDPDREGLRETPGRVSRAWSEWFGGYTEDPTSVLKAFEDGAEGVDEMVVQTGIPVYTHCEHHLAPFFGTADIAYIPDGKVLGLSKLTRLVRVFMRRLQVQERLTQQVADALSQGLSAKGVGVVLRCRHMCMESRGVSVQGTVTTTSALRGVMKTDPSARAEFLKLVG